MRRLALLLLSLAGCEDNRETLFVRQIQVFDAECTVSPDAKALFHSSGTLDVAFRNEYLLTPLLENQMVARESRENVRAEANGIQIEGAIVRLYETPEGSTAPPEESEPALDFFSYASSYIDPENRGVMIFTAIPAEYSEARHDDLCPAPGEGGGATDLLLVGTTVQGITNGGLAVESPEFFFPVTLCCGCLVACSAGADEPDIPGQDCCASEDVEAGSVPCVYGQDGAVDCRLFRGAADPLLNLAARCGFSGTCATP